MKFKVLYFATVAAIATSTCIFSCAKEELDTSKFEQEKMPLGKAKMIEAEAAGYKSPTTDKAVVNLDNRLVIWEEGDQVRLNDATITIEDIRERDTVCTVKGLVSPIQQPGSTMDEYYTVCPASAITSEEDWGGNNGVTPNINLAAFGRQKYSNTTQTQRLPLNYMVGYATTNRDATLKRLYYKNICAVFNIGLKAASGTETISKISLYTSTNQDAVFWSESATLSFTGSNNSAVPSLVWKSGKEKSNKYRKITLDCTANGGVQITSSDYTYFTFYIPIWEGSNIKDLCMEVYNADSSKMMRKTASSSSKMLERNKIYTNRCNLTYDISGYIDADFSISATQTTKFSKGNLQYRASDKKWRFATQQYNIQGVTANQNISSTNTDFIDLFGYGTSGYNGKDPYLTASGIDQGYAANEVFPNQNISNTNYDWGIYNEINGNPKGAYYTWTLAQAQYLIHTRTASTVNGVANARFALCRVNIGSSSSPEYRNGVLLLPDIYSHPAGATAIKKATINEGTNTDSTYYKQNTFSKEDMQLIQAAGGVFLPSAGFRGYSTGGHGDGKTMYTKINPRNFWSMYWTGTNKDKNNAYYVILVKSNFGADPNDPPYFHKYGGRSVRLITNNYHK